MSIKAELRDIGSDVVPVSRKLYSFEYGKILAIGDGRLAGHIQIMTSAGDGMWINQDHVEWRHGLTSAQVEHMVNRFLGWSLPDDFRPDGGISFKPTFNDHLSQPMKYTPTGTNLFDYQQATAMVRYMIEGLPGGDDR